MEQKSQSSRMPSLLLHAYGRKVAFEGANKRNIGEYIRKFPTRVDVNSAKNDKIANENDRNRKNIQQTWALFISHNQSINQTFINMLHDYFSKTEWNLTALRYLENISKKLHPLLAVVISQFLPSSNYTTEIVFLKL